jgi:hypothetical protein
MDGSMIPAEVLTAITALKTDVQTIGGAMFVVVLVVVAFAYFRRSAR